MQEEKKKVAARRTSKTGTSSARNNKNNNTDRDKNKIFNTRDGIGNEVGGILTLGLGILIIIGFFTDRIGKLGLMIKDANFILFGLIGYLFPFFLVLLGVLIVIKKTHRLFTRNSLGILLIVVAVMMFATNTILYISKSMGLIEAFGYIKNLTNYTHGGVIGYLLILPLYVLIDYYGVVILALISLFTGIILILNTSYYNSLKKTKEISMEAREKIRSKINSFAERNAQEKISYLDDEFEGNVKPKQITVDEVINLKDQDRYEKSNHNERRGEKKSFLDFLKSDYEVDETDHEEISKSDELNFDLIWGSNKEESKNLDFSFETHNGNNNEVIEYEERLSIPYFLVKGRSKAVPYKKYEVTKKDKNESDLSKFNFELKDNGTETNNVKKFVNTDFEPGIRKKVDFEPLKPFDKNQPLKEEELGRRSSKNRVDTPVSVPKNLKDVEVEVSEAEKVLPEDKNSTNSLGKAQSKAEASTKSSETQSLENKKKVKPYNFPEISLLRENVKGMLANEDRKEIMENAKKLQDTLMSFGVEATVIHVSKGPSVTRYELQPKAGIKVSKIVNLSDDIALSLAASGVRIEAPIPGKAAIGIEIPNKEQSPVFLREVIQSEKFQKSTQKIAIALGKDITGESVIGDMSKFPHVLIAGATGSGKSVCINSLIVSILYKYTPEEVRLLMVDPKVVELNVYNGIPHLLIPVVTDPKKAAGALNWAVNEMTRRYHLFADHNVKNIEGFNEQYAKGKVNEKLPYIVMIIDELADLMMVAANEIEDYVARLAQMARAAGMHLVIATQRPSVDVITGVIKANIPSRISFAVSSAIDSRTILDQSGAEKLLGKGDMLFYPSGVSKPKRVQGAFVSEEEVEAIVKHVKIVEEDVQYDNSIIEHIEKGGKDSMREEERDELFDEAVRIVIESGQASTSYLQRRMRIGYNRAARIMDELEDEGVISEPDGSKPRKVIWSVNDLE